MSSLDFVQLTQFFKKKSNMKGNGFQIIEIALFNKINRHNWIDRQALLDLYSSLFYRDLVSLEI